MSKFFIIDRFEGNYAVLECGEFVFDVPLGILPEEVKEGDAIEINVCKQLSKKKYEDLFEE
jgi:hypothetical protein